MYADAFHLHSWKVWLLQWQLIIEQMNVCSSRSFCGFHVYIAGL